MSPSRPRDLTTLLNASLNVAALRRAAESVREYDGFDIAKRVAALQLMPENACQLGRLAAAARVACSLPWEGCRPAISAGRFRRILRSPPFTDVLTVHDPRYDDVLCESVGFIGDNGDYLASSGLGAEVPFVLNLMIEVVMSGPGPLPRELTVSAKQLIGATLDLSQTVLTAAGLRRNQLPLGDPTEPITFPDKSRLASLVDAVSFRSRDIATDILTPLIVDAGEVRLDNADALAARPVVRRGDDLIVALPLGLLDALRHALLGLFAAHDALDDLSWQMQALAEREAFEALERLNMRQQLDVDERRAPGGVRESLFAFDDDKLMAVTVLSDDLEHYNVETVVQPSRPRHGASTLSSRARVRSSRLHDHVRGVEVMHLVILASAGTQLSVRPMSPPAGERVLTLSVTELVTLSVIEEGESLALHRFARAREQLKRGADMLGEIDRLDLYALYRDRGYTLAPSGEDALTQSDALGGSLSLRAQAKSERDAHFQLVAPGRSLEVVRFDETTEPIYRARYQLAPGCVAALVEAFDLPVWIKGRPLAGLSRDDLSVDADVVRSIAYWLWQMQDDIRELVTAAAYPMPVLAIAVDPNRESAEGEGVADPEWVTETWCAAAGVLGVRFTTAAWRALGREGNDGERRIMRDLLLGLRELGGSVADREVLSDDALHALLRQQFANPRKKHLISWNALHDVRGIPLEEPYRPVSQADAQVVRLALGRHLIATCDLRRGVAVDPNQRALVLFSARSWCLAEIERIVATLNPDGLLERLMHGYEAVMHARFEQEFKLPTRLACHESLPETQSRLRAERPELARTAIARRFLIEYVAAVPPHGDAPCSLTTHGELLALAAEMQDVASTLDAIDNGMSDTQLALSRTGLLVETSTDAYQQGQWRYFDARLGTDTDHADQRFSRHFADDVVPQSTRRTQLNAVMPHECGLTLDELQGIVDELVILGLETPDAVVAWERGDLVAKLQAQTGWAGDKVARGLAFWELQPRGSFYAVDDEWRRSDVEPWRFRRRLSYIRRPLVLRRDAGGREQLLWGFRHLSEAWVLTFSTLVDGSFPARSPELRAFRGKLVKDNGDQLSGRSPRR